MNKLNVFVVANPATQNEWAILKSSKYKDDFPFEWDFTTDLNLAQVFIWDGLKNSSSLDSYKKIETKMIIDGHVLIWTRGLDFFESFKTTSLINLDQIRYVELNDPLMTPESMIWAINECKKKLSHV